MAVRDLDAAIRIVLDCERCNRIAGHLADYPYSQHDLATAASLIHGQFKSLKDEATLANRRFAASNARYSKLAKKTGQHVPEEEVV